MRARDVPGVRSTIERTTPAHASDVGRALSHLLDVGANTPPGAVSELVDAVCTVLGARAGRLFVTDYSLRSMREVCTNGPVGEPFLATGTLAGRAFSTNEIIAAGSDPTIVWVPLVDGTERLGLLELSFDIWGDSVPPLFPPVVATLVLQLIARRRYTDVWLRTRRAMPLSAAAEVQWDLLPPLACATDDVAVSGIVEPAYAIGGDSFDYALNPDRLDFAIVDAIGHGMSAVLMSSAVINSLRNIRRESGSLIDGYRQADAVIAGQFGASNYVTGQLGSLDLSSGMLTWINAGHVLPMLVRNGTFVGELSCAPSMPMGLGGTIRQVAEEPLQRGDRVLFYTDGITESESPDGTQFGSERLADFLVRATLDQVSVAETARRLGTHVVDYVGVGMNDDATLLLIEYRGGDTRQGARSAVATSKE